MPPALSTLLVILCGTLRVNLGESEATVTGSRCGTVHSVQYTGTLAVCVEIIGSLLEYSLLFRPQDLVLDQVGHQDTQCSNE